MKKMRRWFKPSKLITIPLILNILHGVSVYAEPDNDIIFTDLYTAGARARTQVDYTSMVAQVTIKFIDDYQAQHQRPVPKDIFNEFANGLLTNDPIVRKVYYVPERFLTFIMHSRTVRPITSSQTPEIQEQKAPFVEPMLLGKTLVYHFENQKWVLDKEKSTAPWFANSDMCHLAQSLAGSSVQENADNTMLAIISEARTRLQADYAFKTGEEIINFLKAYQVQYQQAVSQATFNHFVGYLLKKGTDPIISAIQYVPEQSFTVILQNNSFVEPELRGKTLGYLFVKKTWVFDSETSTVPKLIVDSQDHIPYPIDVPESMEIITDHCQRFSCTIAPSQPLWDDSLWCCYWLNYVNPPINEQ
jgi:hypothetical protein